MRRRTSASSTSGEALANVTIDAKDLAPALLALAEVFADELGMSQQIVASYEIGGRRIPVSTLPKLARTLGVSIEALIGESAQPAKRGPTPKLQRHMECISELPKPQQRFLLQMIETALAQAAR